MNIGQKIKNSRSTAGLTQEDVAEKIGVSRQTISNWENDKTYPDIISVIKLSDLYSVSLDILLKEDLEMVKYLHESTDVVKSKQKLSKMVLVIAYLVIWAVSLSAFWISGGNVDAPVYAIFVLYMILPISTLIISFFIGKGDGKAYFKWLMLPFFGIMLFLAGYLTFDLLYMTSHNKFLMPDTYFFFAGMAVAAIGMAVGVIVKFISGKRNKKKLAGELQKDNLT